MIDGAVGDRVLTPAELERSRTHHVVMFSGGVMSWAAAKRVVKVYGTANVTLLFTDTRIEDEDTYRFLHEAAANVGAPLVRVADGRTPWELFRDERFIGNNRVALCSRVLKREQARKWLGANRDPELTTIYLWYDWQESHRCEPARVGWLPWRCVFPMCGPPLMGYDEIKAWALREGLRTQRLYEMGFHHANCGGFCVRGGQAQFRHLLKVMPERYSYHERCEQALRRVIGQDVAILREQRGGKVYPLTMATLREREESACDPFDWGGCGCFSED
jgi:hypothetical protein